MRFIYLHGFASSPGSAKVVYLRDRFADIGISLEGMSYGKAPNSLLSKGGMGELMN
ncbi:hypothetical protein IQ257_28335 [Coleofasciculus sp. LEGE 07092]|uniref:YqiA/YcfP family alpha/beta fold hydrolase n=1 Tax=Coleofasciculus sp. LEGE 07081 TaxID=2777967 RepID=UPI00187E4405|nr:MULTISPECIES: YqiA/YcfP family alpha/beta fold hydrolase [unclassified Coleofasciculus]MBE9127137.1 hypothetical protein [Coleofasciculus sp. LEGE 07081]MBE9152323.1 hypothetical protein [Coleofasciculus sp. LEGE 07092]